MADYSYIGVGKIHARVRGSTTPLTFIGNCSSLRLSISEETKQLKDFTKPGGGNYNEIRRIDNVEFSMTVHDLSPENLARAVFGDVASITSGSASGEDLDDVYVGGLSVTAYPIDTSKTVTVAAKKGGSAGTYAVSTVYAQGDYVVPSPANGYFYKCTTAGTSDGTAPSWSTTTGGTITDGTVIWTVMGKVAPARDVDFIASAGGITFLEGAAITNDEEMTVTYEKLVAHTVDALLNASQEYEFFFDGLNEARSGKSTLVHLYRVKLGATDGLDLIGEDYYAGTQTGQVLKDDSKNGTNESQYFRATIAA